MRWAVARGRLRHRLRRLRIAGGGRDDAGPGLHRRTPRPASRPRHHARARGPYRGRGLALAATALPGLCLALRRRRAPPQAFRSATPAGCAGACHSARRLDRAGTVFAKISSRGSLHPGGAGARHQNAARDGASYRRLQARSVAAGRAADGRGGVRPARRSGRAGDDLRFDQRHGRRPFRFGGGCPPQPFGADPRSARPDRGHVLREQCRARGVDRVGRTGGGQKRHAGRPLAPQSRRRRARNRLSPGRAGVRVRGGCGIGAGTTIFSFW